MNNKKIGIMTEPIEEPVVEVDELPDEFPGRIVGVVMLVVSVCILSGLGVLVAWVMSL